MNARKPPTFFIRSVPFARCATADDGSRGIQRTNARITLTERENAMFEKWMQRASMWCSFTPEGFKALKASRKAGGA